MSAAERRELARSLAAMDYPRPLLGVDLGLALAGRGRYLGAYLRRAGPAGSWC